MVNVKRSWVGMVIAGTAVASFGAAGCGDNREPRDQPYFKYDGQRTIGSMSFDGVDVDNDATNDEPLLSKMQTAKDENWVVMMYGHQPGAPLETIEAVLSAANDAGLPFYTFADLAATYDEVGAAKPGITISFDDTEVDDWYALRPLFAQYNARATFFVTRFTELTDAQHAELHTLYDEGNSIEAHGVHHVDAKDYVAANGLDAYIDDEVQPSIDVLRADGFTPVAFAHPYGVHTEEIDDAIVERINLARSISQTPLPGRDCW